MTPPALSIHPPLLNSATPWATSKENLRDILLSKSTGAVTTRTSLINGFHHQHEHHQYLFFEPGSSKSDAGTSSTSDIPFSHSDNATASLNNLGYSLILLEGYLGFLQELAREYPDIKKTVLISVTGPVQDILLCYEKIGAAAESVTFPLVMEINLSCPNIPGAPPPAYDGDALREYLSELPKNQILPIGVKTPPYTHQGQFETLIEALQVTASSLSFLTTTNTLGSCLVLENNSGGYRPQLPDSGFGGMAGPPLHPLALGNVAKIRQLLDAVPELSHLQIIGVGGFRDGEGYRRMRSVGAYAVAVGTGLGDQGTDVFGRIESDIASIW